MALYYRRELLGRNGHNISYKRVLCWLTSTDLDFALWSRASKDWQSWTRMLLRKRKRLLAALQCHASDIALGDQRQLLAACRAQAPQACPLRGIGSNCVPWGTVPFLMRCSMSW